MGLFDFASIRRSVAGLEQKLKGMQTEVEELRRQRVRVMTAPTSKEDVKEMLSAWLALNSKKYREALHETLSKFRNPRNLTQDDMARYMSITGAAQPGGEALRTQDVDQALCALFAPLLKDALFKEIESMEWSENTMNNAQRAKDAERLDERIYQLDTEIAALINGAEESGINWRR